MALRDAGIWRFSLFFAFGFFTTKVTKEPFFVFFVRFVVKSNGCVCEQGSGYTGSP